MRSMSHHFILVGAALLAGGSAQAQTSTRQETTAASIAVRDFFRKPEKSHFQISEDGQTLSFMQPIALDGTLVRRNVFVQALEGSKPVGEPRRLTAESARDISGYSWKGNSNILYTKDFGGDENFHIVSVDVASGKVTDLTPWPGVRANLENNLIDDPDHILSSHNRRNKEVFDVYRYDLRTGKDELVAQNPGNVEAWAFDHAGHVRLATVSDGLLTHLQYRTDDKTPFKTIVSTDYKTFVNPFFFDAKNEKFYASSNRGRDKAALVLIDPAKPDVEQVLFEHPQVDIESASWSDKEHKLTHIEYHTAKLERRFVEPRIAGIFNAISKQLPGYEITLQGQNKAEDKFVVASGNDLTQGTRYIYDAKSNTLSKLAELTPWLPEAAMSESKPIQYSARDGLVINGYLTLPKNRDAKNLACVVNPHGGPWARDTWRYDPEVQMLASRGYCVLQMNFRGSTGYGRQFWEASFGQWGLAMQDDVTAGVHWLVKQGIADPKRVGIYGGSYGGYTTLAGVAFTPALYAAAVDYVGVANMLSFMSTIPPYWELFRTKMYAMVGDPKPKRDWKPPHQRCMLTASKRRCSLPKAPKTRE